MKPPLRFSYLPFLICCLFTSKFTFAQSWQWAYGSNGLTGMCEAYGSQCISVDNFGNVYTVSRVEPIYGPTTLGSDSLPTGTFIIKTNAVTGIKDWVKSGYKTLEYNSIIADNRGNLYYTGTFIDSISFGTFNLSSPSSSNNFCLVKFDSSGTVLWARQSNGMGSHETVDIAVDRFGFVYVIGEFNSPSLILGPDTFVSNTCTVPTCYGTFLAKYNPTSGDVVWAKSIVIDPTQLGFVKGKSITVDDMGNVFIVGNYGDILGATSISIGVDTVPLPGANGTILAKFDSVGNLVWIKPNKNLVKPNLIRANGFGEIYLTGDFTASDSILGVPLVAIGSRSFFVAKVNQLGNVIWMKEGGHHGMSYAAGGMYVYPDGKLYITGGEYPVDSGSKFTFDGTTFTCLDSVNDLSFIVKLDSSGNVLSGYLLNSGGDDWLGITVDNVDNLYISGDYVDSLVLPGHVTLLNPVSTIYGHETFFVAKYVNDKEQVSFVGNNRNLIDIYPNPANNEITVSSTDKLRSLIITDLMGHKITNYDCNTKKLVLDVADLPLGIYLIKINGLDVRKFVKL